VLVPVDTLLPPVVPLTCPLDPPAPPVVPVVVTVEDPPVDPAFDESLLHPQSAQPKSATPHRVRVMLLLERSRGPDFNCKDPVAIRTLPSGGGRPA
jgi:hypothetical protein